MSEIPIIVAITFVTAIMGALCWDVYKVGIHPLPYSCAKTCSSPTLPVDMTDGEEGAAICSRSNKHLYVIYCFLAGHVVSPFFLPNMAAIFSAANILDFR